MIIVRLGEIYTFLNSTYGAAGDAKHPKRWTDFSMTMPCPKAGAGLSK